MKRKIAIAATIAVLASVGAAYAMGIRYNHSESMPLGIWKLTKIHEWHRGDVVAACPDLTPTQQVFLDPGVCPNGHEPVLKFVAAVEGDWVSVGSDGIMINNELFPNSAPQPVDRGGRPIIAYPRGLYIVPSGQVWLLVPRADSFDSRYFGPVSANLIHGGAEPWVTWR